MGKKKGKGGGGGGGAQEPQPPKGKEGGAQEAQPPKSKKGGSKQPETQQPGQPQPSGSQQQAQPPKEGKQKSQPQKGQQEAQPQKGQQHGKPQKGQQQVHPQPPQAVEGRQPGPSQPQPPAGTWGRSQAPPQTVQPQPEGPWKQQRGPPPQPFPTPQQSREPAPSAAGRGQPPQGRGEPQGRGQPVGRGQRGPGGVASPSGFSPQQSREQTPQPGAPWGRPTHAGQGDVATPPGFTPQQSREQTPQPGAPWGGRGPQVGQGDAPGFVQAPQQVPQGDLQRGQVPPPLGGQAPPPQVRQGPPPQGPPSQSQGPPPPQRGGPPAEPAKSKGKGKGKQQPAKEKSPEQKAQHAKEVADIKKGFYDMQIGVKPKRVTPGTKGRKILIETNHLALNLKALTAYHYDVKIDPNLPKKFLRDVFELYRQKHMPNRYPAFDNRQNAYASSLLPYTAEDTITIDDGGRAKVYKVKLTCVRELEISLDFLMSTLDEPADALQCIDIVLRSAPGRSCLAVGRSFFTKPNQIIDLGDGMEMYHGFYQSAIRGWKPFLNVDVAHKAFPKEMNLIDLICELNSDFRNKLTERDLIKNKLQNWQVSNVERFLKKLRVCYEIPGQSATKRKYGVNGLDQCPREKTFKDDTGRTLTIERYYKEKKNYTLRFPFMPTVWVGAVARENKILLPSELCMVMPGQAVNRKMTENQTSNMIKVAATSTTVRKDKILQSVRQANYNNDPSVREFGFTVGDAFEKLEARVLEPPHLIYANNRAATPQKGVWRGDGQKFWSAAEVQSWTIICADRYAPQNLREFADMIYRMGAANGMNFVAKADEPFKTVSQRQNDLAKYFESNSKYSVVFVVVPNSGDTYANVKKAAEINVGCLTQCIKAKTLSRLSPQTVANILLKVNSKLNGVNHILHDKPPIMKVPTIIMGADVTHPGPECTNIPSVAAVTASYDARVFKYNICWRLQPPTVEIIEDLKNIVVEQLKYFHTRNKGVKPLNIIFFRDGVSAGQFEEVRHKEIKAIRDACMELQPDGSYQPKITFLVVQKRHHTRLFPTNPRDSEDRNFNVPAGTVVDHLITNPMIQNFYLVSHASIQGVAKPTKYCTIWDDNDLSHDDIEQLSYYLCHMFSRCNRSVSYPAPTYYAHLAAARAKVYIEAEQNLNMNRLREVENRLKIKDCIRVDLPMFFV